MKRIPRASREHGQLKLATPNNSSGSGERLIHFRPRCLRRSSWDGRCWSMATMVNKQLREEEDSLHLTMISFSKRRTASQDP